jgi:serine/threonine protein kinase
MSPSTSLPARLGRYLLTARIGEAELTQSFDAQLDGPPGARRRVVVKTPLPELAGHPELHRRLRSEARIASLLHHPNLIEMHEFGIADGVTYLAHEYLDGKTLLQLLQAARAQGRPVPVDAALAILRQLCDGLGYAHNFTDGSALRQSIVHGDVSPSNVLLCRDGTVKLIDFARARIGGRFAKFSCDALRGGGACRAPEQIGQKPIDVRLDVFHAGIVCYELLAGRPPFADNHHGATAKGIRTAGIVAPSQHNPDVPLALDAITLQALARDPADRFANGAQMALALDRCGTEVEAFSRDRLATYYRALFDEPTIGRATARTDRQSPIAIGRSPRPDRVVERRRRARPNLLAAPMLVFGLLTPFSLDSARFRAEERSRPPAVTAPLPQPASAPAPPPSGGYAPPSANLAPSKRTPKRVATSQRRAAAARVTAPRAAGRGSASTQTSDVISGGGIVDPFAAL